MTTIELIGSDRNDLAQRAAARMHTHSRGPDFINEDDGTTTLLRWVDDLTPEELVEVNHLLDMAHSETGLSVEGYADIRAQMQTLRALRQMGRNAFMALTAAERDRLTCDALVAVTQIFISMQRDT